jgi:hypothetical protein
MTISDYGSVVFDNGKPPEYILPFMYLDDNWQLIPKPKVIKRIEGWVNVYPSAFGLASLGALYPSKEKAQEATWKPAFGEPLFISHEYESEE